MVVLSLARRKNNILQPKSAERRYLVLVKSKDATVAEWNSDGTYTILRQGTND
jgi:hypothetical protein